MRRSRALLLPVLALALWLLPGCYSSGDWRTASRVSAGLAPDPSATPEAVLQGYGADAWGWRGWSAIHTWIAAKRTGEGQYKVYDVVGMAGPKGAAGPADCPGNPRPLLVLLAGAPIAPGTRAALFEGRPPRLDCVYACAAVLGLAGLAVAVGPRVGRLAAAGALFFLVAAMGRHSVLSAALASAPGFALMRYPQKHLLPFALCLALAAGYGMSVWAASWPAGRRRRGRVWARVLMGVGCALACAAVWLSRGPAPLVALLEDPSGVGPAALAASLRVGRSAVLLGVLGLLLAFRAERERAPAAATCVLSALAAFDLVAVGRTVNPLAPPELAAHRPAVVVFFKNYSPPARQS